MFLSTHVFFKALNSSEKYSQWVFLNILNSACSIYLTVILLEISVIANFRFQNLRIVNKRKYKILTENSCLNFKRHVICNTRFFNEE